MHILWDNAFFLVFTGFIVGTVGTLIGAGGGFIIVPFLIIIHPALPTEILTAISIAVVACNAISGSVAYARSKTIDYRAGRWFAAFTIPGSIAGVYSTAYIPKIVFHVVFGLLVIGLAALLFFQKKAIASSDSSPLLPESRKNTHTLMDATGTVFTYEYRPYLGAFISLIVGYLSPILGIGGGIIHVPALVKWLGFPIRIATATSHFILAVMATVSVIVHVVNGNYNGPHIMYWVVTLSTGVVAGAQLGAFLSHRVQGQWLIRILSVCLLLVGLRVLLSGV
ncbi:MAG TPA: sulfite exporter TauE/SafE family protein [Chitinophagaceae bacterium]|nr:sulfite exporter TauE/SafE family protein [Chitinophagaceae bacterium]